MIIQRGVIVALNKIEAAEKVRDFLCDYGYEVLAVCTTGGELIRRAIQYSPELIVSGYKFSDMTLLDVYDALSPEEYSFLAIVNEMYRSYISDDMDVYCISGPISKAVLSSAVDMIFQSRSKLLRLQKKVEKLEVKIEERKVIDKAKGELMSNMGFTEMEAFRYIQKHSMDSGLKMSEIAERIISGDANITP